MLCRHCQLKNAERRGLCWKCRLDPALQSLYPPPPSVYLHRGVADFNGRGATPLPTDARPGTPEKIAVMAKRAEAGQELFHPLDAGLDSE